HTFGSNHNFNLVLHNGGSLYIDDGKPLPGAIDTTARNLRDIAPTIYFNVPKGFEMLLPHLAAARALREKFFSRLKVMFYAGASLSQHVADAIQKLAVETTGERVMFLASLGSTETAAASSKRGSKASTSRPAITRRRSSRPTRSTTRAFTRSATRSSSPTRPIRPRACCSTAASTKTISSPPAPGSASGRCAELSSRISHPWCATWCWPVPTGTTS